MIRAVVVSLLVLAFAGAFLWFVWPTPWEYVAVPPGVPALETDACSESHLGDLNDDQRLEKLASGAARHLIAPFLAGLDEIVGGRARLLSEEQALRVLADAQVVLLADSHFNDGLRKTQTLLVESLESMSTERGRLLLEALPLGSVLQDPIDQSMARRALRESWAFPVEPLVELIHSLAPVLSEVRGVGKRPDESILPKGAVPDRERRPRGIMPEEWRAQFWKQSPPAVLEEVQQAHERGRIYVIFGTFHMLGPNEIMPTLQRAGIAAKLVVAYLPEWSLALAQRDGPKACASWYEVLPGVLKCPDPPADPRAQ